MTYNDLSVYLREKVPLESVLVNSKEQNPVVNSSQDIAALWKSWKVR